MRKTLLVAVALVSFSSPTWAKGPLSWFSAPVFLGQGATQHGSKDQLQYIAGIASTTDANGYNHIWLHYGTVQTQESFADHEAIQLRAACNATGDDSCVQGQPGWVEILAQFTYPH